MIFKAGETIRENIEYGKLADKLLGEKYVQSFITISENGSDKELKGIDGKHKFSIGQTIYSKQHKKMGTILGFRVYENGKLEYVIEQILFDNSEKRQDVPVEFIDEEDYQVMKLDG